jgi:hypothetical protein
MTDFSYEASTGHMDLHGIGNLVSLFDPGPGPLSGVVSSTIFSLDSTFTGIIPGIDYDYVRFAGGQFNLAFDFDPDGPGPAPTMSHQIAGPIAELTVALTPVPAGIRLDAYAFVRTPIVDLPGSGIWHPSRSMIDSLIVVFPQPYSGWNFNSDLVTQAETWYQVFPGWAPEPSTLLLCGAGAGMCCRRKVRKASSH